MEDVLGLAAGREHHHLPGEVDLDVTACPWAGELEAASAGSQAPEDAWVGVVRAPHPVHLAEGHHRALCRASVAAAAGGVVALPREQFVEDCHRVAAIAWVEIRVADREATARGAGAELLRCSRVEGDEAMAAGADQLRREGLEAARVSACDSLDRAHDPADRRLPSPKDHDHLLAGHEGAQDA